MSARLGSLLAILGSVVAAATSLSRVAHAQTEPAPATPSAPVAPQPDPAFAPPPVTDEAPHRNRPPFAVSFGVEGGLTYFTESGPFGTDTGVGLGLAPGYNLGLRASFEVFSWLAVDARGLLMNNNANTLLNYGSLTTAGGMGAVRLTLPVPHVRPYVLLGYGGYHEGASGSQSQLISGTFSAFEVGLGATVPTGRNFEVGVEWLYSHLNSETLSTNPKADGGDPSTMSIFVQYRLPL